MPLFDEVGRRLYLNGEEREAFGLAAAKFSPQIHTLSLTLLQTGCRISEALALTAERVDFRAGTLVFESLKKRRRGVYRAVPVPHSLLETIVAAHDLQNGGERLWRWSRRTAYAHIKMVMGAAGIEGACASPKGLRHGFGVACLENQIALNMVQKWLGHSQLATTAIYANAVGQEERELAARLWK